VAKKLTIKLPDPGLPADHHRDDQVVFYHGQHGEFLVNGKVADPPVRTPITDERGNSYTVKELRDLAAAALAVVDLAMSIGHQAT
jgi:hypothetical protein